jgi:alpha-glucosidase (family GH31 glycosyl hydrolase)
MYTCLKDVAWDSGTSCFDPLFFHYSLDDETFKKVEESFIFANVMKVTPVLQGSRDQKMTLNTYFPKGRWVNMNNFADIVDSKGGSNGWKDIEVDMSEASMIPLHLMPGKVVIKQNGQFNTAADLALGTKSNITLIANREKSGGAHGRIFFDDGESSAMPKAEH